MNTHVHHPTSSALLLGMLWLHLTPVAATFCKAVPGTPHWPCDADWQALNHSMDGRLLKPLPPAAVCHADQPTFDLQACNTTHWNSSATYAEDPLGIINPNWANDSCLPSPQLPCSGDGYPVYVVNASTAQHVAAGVDFARRRNIRLNVKGSGHDYLGRSNAPNALSIWTKHIRGMEFADDFRPRGCSCCAPIPAVTLGAGEAWGDIYASAHDRGRTLVGGTGDTIGLGGYLTGGGHSPLSAKLGLAVDQVLEMEVVLASGQHVVVNEAMNSDVFWAMRGGGGATFGVMTSVTLKTFPDMPIAAVGVVVGAEANSAAFWDMIALIVSSAPRLQAHGVMGYSYFSPDTTYSGSVVGGFLGTFLLPNGTTEELDEATRFLREGISALPGVTADFTPTQFGSLYAWYEVNKNEDPIGGNVAVGNRLLDADALSNRSALRAAMQKATPSGTIANLNLVSGPGLRNAVPAGGSDSVLPAWRDAYIEYAVPVGWPFLNDTAKEIQTHLLTHVYMEALRELAPDTGSYLNEGDVNEPNWQQAFWGSHYSRLLDIKHDVDPTDVFWCSVCVGSEARSVKSGRLCRE